MSATPYDDIINLPHHVSTRHPQMPRHDRAAQFAPFAALVGYDDALDETARITDCKPELDEHEREHLDWQLRSLAAHIASHPRISLERFIPDALKQGGAIVTMTGFLTKISSSAQTLSLNDDTIIPLDSILAIHDL